MEKTSLKIVVAGSRNFNDYELLKETLDNLLGNISPTETVEIVSGTARGADRFGERYARERNYALKRFPANWDKYGKSAGYIRNEEMARYSNYGVIFWDESSRGTKHMIDLLHKYGIKCEVITF